MFVELLALFVAVTVISFAAWLRDIEQRTRQFAEWQTAERPLLRKLRRILSYVERLPRPARPRPESRPDPAAGLEPGDVHPFAADAFVTRPPAGDITLSQRPGVEQR